MQFGRIMAVLTLLAVLLLSASAFEYRHPKPLMGFTTWPWAATQEAVDETAAFIRHNGETVAEQFDNGIPWDAILHGKPWPEKFEAEINGRLAHRSGIETTILSLNPLSILRDGIAPDVASGSAPDLGPHPFANPKLADAYAEYAGKMLKRFHATYLVYGIEVNEFLAKHPEQWSDFVAFMKRVRPIILSYDDLYLGQSVSLHNLANLAPKDRAQAIEKLRELTADDTFIAISYYPFLAGHRSRQQIKEAFDLAAQLHSPRNITQFMIVSETAEIGEPLVIPSLKANIPGSEKIQTDYVQALMEETTERRYYTVTWFAHRDYDQLLASFPPAFRDIGMIWRDTGLIDEHGRERAALSRWKQWLNLTDGTHYPLNFKPHH